MNICFLSQEYPPETHVGGIGTYTYNMACALAKLGHTVHVIASTEDVDHTNLDKGVWVHRIKRRKIKPLELGHLIYSYQVAKKIRSINCKFDIVQASEYASEAFCFSINKTSPLVTRLATPFYLVEDLNGKKFFGPRPFFNLMEKKQAINSDGIFSSTHALADAVSSKWDIAKSQVAVIPNSIDLSRVRRLGGNCPVPGELKEKEFMIYFGRLEERKGVDVLARALLPVFEQFPDIYMVFVGADTDFHKVSMRRRIEEHVGRFRSHLIFYDNQPHEKLFPIVKASKLVILPSLWEAFGFVCVEAMALGKPVIASSGSGFAEIIENSISGFLVEPGNKDTLSHKIISSLKDEENLNRISERAVKRAEDFEVSKISLRLLEYYETIQAGWQG